jgi:L-ascorbate metabolism protein UlaG (beta-lactamase superfamily)
MNECYLRLDTKIEPLSWQWYSWPYLISPATAACNIAERHIPIMKSYISFPKLHEQALKNPKLIGGPYADLKGKYLEEVKELLKDTETRCNDLLKLNRSLKELDIKLQNEFDGQALDNFYGHIPDELKGIIELVYDLNNRPAIRLIEALFYKKYDVASEQSLALSTIKEDFRPFVLSTPYIKKDNILNLQVPFNDERIDKLVQSRFSKVNFKYISELFNVSVRDIELFKSFFTEDAPKEMVNQKYEGNGVRIRYFGHACVLFETKEISILIDPVVSYDFYNTTPRFSFKDLPDKIDYVLLTHNHQDHVLMETLLQLRYKIKNIIVPTNNKGFLADPSLKMILKHLGFKSVIALDEFESISFEGGEIIGLPFFGEHADLNIQSKIAYFLRLKKTKIILAADSNNIEPTLYDFIFKYLGPIDMLFIGMECDGAPLTWLYGPLLSKQIKKNYDTSRTLSGSNFEKAWLIAKLFQCKYAYVYAMGQEPWLGYIMALEYTKDSIQITESDKFVKTCVENNILSERLFGKKEWIIS